MKTSFYSKAFIPGALLAAALMLPAPILAQSDEFSQLMTEGIRLYREASSDPSKYERAIEAFLKAKQIDPIPDITYNIARSYHMLGNCPSALSNYREYEVAVKKVGGGKDVTEYINVLALQCGQEMGTITLRCTPVDSTVSIDNERPVACTGTHRVKSGERRLVFVAPDQSSSSRMVTVSTNSNIDLDIRLNDPNLRQPSYPRYPTPAQTLPPVASQTRPDIEVVKNGTPIAAPVRALGDRKLFWAGIGTTSGGAVFSILGGVLIGVADKKFDGWCVKDNNGKEICPSIYERNTATYNAGIAFTTIGAVAAAAGITMLIIDAVWDNDARKSVAYITPSASFGEDSASFGLSLTF